MKLNEANQSDGKFWEGLCYFCVHSLCDVWVWDSFEALPVFAIFRPLGKIVRVTNTDESLTMCHNIWANEKTRFHGTITALGLKSVGQGRPLNFGISLVYLCVFLFDCLFVFGPNPKCQFFFMEKPANVTNADKRECYFLDLISCFQTPQRFHLVWCVWKKD